MATPTLVRELLFTKQFKGVFSECSLENSWRTCGSQGGSKGDQRGVKAVWNDWKLPSNLYQKISQFHRLPVQNNQTLALRPANAAHLLRDLPPPLPRQPLPRCAVRLLRCAPHQAQRLAAQLRRVRGSRRRRRRGEAVAGGAKGHLEKFARKGVALDLPRFLRCFGLFLKGSQRETTVFEGTQF